MSYCRNDGVDSNVYVYPTVHSDGELLECTCGEEGHNLTRAEMILHLVKHIQKGDKVPYRAFERLMREILQRR
jgi:hypothetical protein